MKSKLVLALGLMLGTAQAENMPPSWPPHGDDYCLHQARIHHTERNTYYLCSCRFNERKRNGENPEWTCR